MKSAPRLQRLAASRDHFAVPVAAGSGINHALSERRSLWSADGSTSIYNSTVGALGNFVESAVINQDIELR